MEGEKSREKTRNGGVKDDRTISGRNERLGGERTQVRTGSVSVPTVDTTDLLRRTRTGDAEGPWGLVGSTRGKHEGA